MCSQQTATCRGCEGRQGQLRTRGLESSFPLAGARGYSWISSGSAQNAFAVRALKIRSRVAVAGRHADARSPTNFKDTAVNMSSAQTNPPTREVHCLDSIPWMRARGVIDGAVAVTSLPDVSELRLSMAAWRIWFLETVTLVVGSVSAESAAVFFQSDIKHDGAWIDKGALVVRAAEDAGARVLFHKVVSRRQPGLLTFGRPGYTHLIAVSRAMRCPDALPIPDIIVDAGRSPWVRAMGVRAAAHAVRFARDQAQARVIFDPFCGVGTVLAVANALGVDAAGVELSRKRCEQSRVLQVRADEL